MLTNTKPSQPFLLCLQAVGEAVSHLAGHTTASPPVLLEELLLIEGHGATGIHTRINTYIFLYT